METGTTRNQANFPNVYSRCCYFFTETAPSNQIANFLRPQLMQIQNRNRNFNPRPTPLFETGAAPGRLARKSSYRAIELG